MPLVFEIATLGLRGVGDISLRGYETALASDAASIALLLAQQAEEAQERRDDYIPSLLGRDDRPIGKFEMLH